MDDRFRSVFSEQAEVYRASQVFVDIGRFARFYPYEYAARSLAMVDEAIESAVASLDGEFELRSDARVFLLVNLHQMVAVPLSHPESPVELGDKLGSGLRRDAALILNAAVEDSAEEQQREITSSAILRTIPRVLGDLFLKEWRLWDQR